MLSGNQGEVSDSESENCGVGSHWICPLHYVSTRVHLDGGSTLKSKVPVLISPLVY